MLKTFVVAAVAITTLSTSCHALVWYVAADGSGTTCSSTQPCGSLDAALSNALANDVIVCISTPKVTFGLNINKPITVDCGTAHAVVRDASITTTGVPVGVVVNTTGSVVLRGVNIDGFTDGQAYYTRSLEILAASTVTLEDCIINYAKQQGIYDHRSGGQTKLYVKDTRISNVAGPGIVAASAGTAITVLDNVSLLTNTYGIAAATGNNVSIRNSTISGNTTAGIEADFGAQVTVERSLVSNNASNVAAFGTVRLSESHIQFSNTAITGSGSVISLGGNKFTGNGTQGVTPSLASGAQGDVFN